MAGLRNCDCQANWTEYGTNCQSGRKQRKPYRGCSRSGISIWPSMEPVVARGRRFLLEPTVEAVIRRSQCPVLTVGSHLHDSADGN